MNYELELEKLKKKDLYRTLNYFESEQDSIIKLNNKNVILLSSNNYLGLCSDERLKKVAINAINKFGVGSGGSRLTTGSYTLHRELENIVAQFKEKERALIFNTGFMANTGVISTLANKDWVVFCDRLNHASIVEGCRLSGAKLVIYKHCDMEDLEKKLLRYKSNNSLIVTDSVFSMDGDIAPLDNIVRLAKKYKTLVMVDEAHATGVFGKNGRGITEEFGLCRDIDICVGTFSKALASEGGFVVGDKSLIEYIKQKAKSFIYSTALSPAVIAVSIESIKIVMKDNFHRNSLLEKSKWFRKELQKLGFNVEDGKSPILPIIIGDTQKALKFSKELLNNGIYVPAIRPPTVPKGTSRLRVSLMSTHKKEQLEYVLKVMNNIYQSI